MATDTLAAALTAAQAEMPAVEPNAVNPHFRSRFVSLDHLIAKTRPVLNRHGLSLTQWPSVSETGQPTLTTRLTHVSGEFVENTMPLLLAKQDMQGLGGAITYARRYAWAAALGICADEDDDGNQASAPATATAVTNGNGRVTADGEQVDALMALAEQLVGAERVSVQQVASAAGGVIDETATVDGLRPLLANLDPKAAADLLARLERYAKNTTTAAATA